MNGKRLRGTLLGVATAASLGVWALNSWSVGPQTRSPYAGQETREIKALSAQDVDDLLSARGLALAKAAELNGYPGPTHVLELAPQLKLTPEQSRIIGEIKSKMAEAAKPLGVQIVARERELDRQFMLHEIKDAQLSAETAEIGKLFGQLRGIHLRAHLETTANLSAQQTALYNELRGYGSPAGLQTHDPAQHEPKTQ
jgi:hypothetical protein